ncbi:Hypothetical predicted protein [Paramuricea clavata]|uniref:Uncharacterized protein n=1 Tax=Paramuricea clavata TaxID=317549 RepID=A0A7D9IN05_PARCT|nr:Hypothetical predicted protein [Paramuricea clavata]
MADSHKIKTYVERHGCEMCSIDKISVLSYLLMKQPYNPILWVLYSVCTYLHGCKPKSFKHREIRIRDYYVAREHWLSGSFSDIRDIIAIDNVTTKQPRTSIATLYAPDIQSLTPAESLVNMKTLYNIPVEWIPYIATCENLFVLLPFTFCCREVLIRTSTKMVRCQSLQLEPQYLVDDMYFHVGCGPCCDGSDVMVEVFAALPIHVGIHNLMTVIAEYDFRNPAEMLYAVGRYEPVLPYFISKDEHEAMKGSEVRKYLAHILVCKECYKYLFDFLMLVDQSVSHHPYPNHVDVSKDRLNDAGIPIFEYVLDAEINPITV